LSDGTLGFGAGMVVEPLGGVGTNAPGFGVDDLGVVVLGRGTLPLCGTGIDVVGVVFIFVVVGFDNV